MILCGTDLSPVSEPVIKAAAAVARKQARELLLVTVLEREDASSLTLADRPIPFGYSQLSHGGTLHLVHAACDTPKEGHEALKAELQTVFQETPQRHPDRGSRHRRGIPLVGDLAACRPCRRRFDLHVDALAQGHCEPGAGLASTGNTAALAYSRTARAADRES